MEREACTLDDHCIFSTGYYTHGSPETYIKKNSLIILEILKAICWTSQLEAYEICRVLIISTSYFQRRLLHLIQPLIFNCQNEMVIVQISTLTR